LFKSFTVNITAPAAVPAAAAILTRQRVPQEQPYVQPAESGTQPYQGELRATNGTKVLPLLISVVILLNVPAGDYTAFCKRRQQLF
jgi:hypothetical protein